MPLSEAVGLARSIEYQLLATVPAYIISIVALKTHSTVHSASCYLSIQPNTASRCRALPSDAGCCLRLPMLSPESLASYTPSLPVYVPALVSVCPAHCSQALEKVQKLLAEYDQQNNCLPWKAWEAGSMITRVQIVSDELDRARGQFCQSVVTRKALGELAAESMARTQAERARLQPPADTFIVQKGGGWGTGCTCAYGLLI